MPYLSLLQLADSPGALELAQVASSSTAPVVDAALLERVLTGADTGGDDSDDVAAAQAVADRLESAIANAGELIDGYIGRRYALPLGSAPGILVTWARAIVRYKLHKDRITDERSDPVARDYRDALKFLEQIAEGRFSLGVEDPQAGASGLGEVQFNTGAKVFGREHLP